jgi:hypothetical protein
MVNDILNQWWWMVPLTLVIVASVQILYLIWLRVAPSRHRTVRQPESPLMPTVPQGGVPGQHPYQDVGKMVIVSGLPPREIRLNGQYMGIGRYHDPRNNIHIALDEKSVSRKHAVLEYDEAYQIYFLRDSNSSYGTYIRFDAEFQQLPPDKRERIYRDDVVRFGHAVTVRFDLPGERRQF